MGALGPRNTRQIIGRISPISERICPLGEPLNKLRNAVCAPSLPRATYGEPDFDSRSEFSIDERQRRPPSLLAKFVDALQIPEAKAGVYALELGRRDPLHNVDILHDDFPNGHSTLLYEMMLQT